MNKEEVIKEEVFYMSEFMVGDSIKTTNINENSKLVKKMLDENMKNIVGYIRTGRDNVMMEKERQEMVLR